MIVVLKYPVRFGDPILGLSLNHNYLLFGTAFGKAAAYDI